MVINNITYNKNKVNYLVSQHVKLHKGKTQDSVASEIGVSKGTLYSSNPTVETIIKICVFFNIEIKELFTNKEANNRIGKNKETNDNSTISINIHEPPTELKECYKIMYEQQKEISEQQKRNNELENRVKELEGRKKYTLPDVPVSHAAEAPAELKKKQ